MRPAFTILMLSVFLVVTQHIAAGACGNLAKGGATQPTRKGIVWPLAFTITLNQPDGQRVKNDWGQNRRDIRGRCRNNGRVDGRSGVR